MRTLFIAIIALSLYSCVQKTKRHTVVFTLNTGDQKEIKTAGIRGEDQPLNWQSDSSLQEVVKDSLYQVTMEFITGYTFTEYKFTLNGDFEKDLKNNRRVYFKGDTTRVENIFNKQ